MRTVGREEQFALRPRERANVRLTAVAGDLIKITGSGLATDPSFADGVSGTARRHRPVRAGAPASKASPGDGSQVVPPR